MCMRFVCFQMFLLETSGRPRLTPRQSCAVESAVAGAGLRAVVLMLRSPVLDLSDATTCRLYRRHGGRGLHFHRIVPRIDLAGKNQDESHV